MNSFTLGGFHPADLARINDNDIWLTKFLQDKDLDMDGAFHMLWDTCIWRTEFGTNGKLFVVFPIIIKKNNLFFLKSFQISPLTIFDKIIEVTWNLFWFNSELFKFFLFFFIFKIWASISLTQVTILTEKLSLCSDANFTNVERRIWMPWNGSSCTGSNGQFANKMAT